MIGETALHTRAKCDECRVRTATRETHAGVFCETCEPDTPRAANDDAQGASCTIPLCTRCHTKPAFLRIDATLILCAECLNESDVALLAAINLNSSFAVASPGDNVTAAGLQQASLTPFPDRAGAASGPQDSIPVSAPAPPPSTADASSKLATLRPVAVFSSADPGAAGFFDLETDALVSGLEAGWILERRNSQTLRVIAASEMAPKSGSENPTPST